jgi:hypothetical protein
MAVLWKVGRAVLFIAKNFVKIEFAKDCAILVVDFFIFFHQT